METVHKIALCHGWPAGQRPRVRFLTVILQRATSYTRALMNIIPSTPHSHTYLCARVYMCLPGPDLPIGYVDLSLGQGFSACGQQPYWNWICFARWNFDRKRG